VATELTSHSKQSLPQEWDLDGSSNGAGTADEDLAARLDRLEQRLDAFESTCYTFLLYAKQLSDRTVSFFEDIFGLSREDLSQIHDRLGVNANNKGDYDRAIESFKKLTDLNRTAESCFKLGVAYDNNGNLQEAIEAFRGAIDLDATLLDAH
jgi:tetratricopeptide (TPR) repeat protein